MNKMIDIVQSIADRLTLSFENDILFDDVAHALFMLWEHEKGLNYADEIFELDFDFDSTYQLLKHFNFEMFQQVVFIDAAYYKDLLQYDYNKQPGEKWSLKWRICSYDERGILSIPYLFQPENNIKLDLRSGACMIKNSFFIRIPLEKLVFIRKWTATLIPKALPSLYIN